MAELKTKRNAASVEEFIDTIADQQKREDSHVLIKLMSSITGCPPEMWGGSIIGFGRYNYKYKSGREGEWFLCGFSPRKRNMSVYVMGSSKEIEDLISGIGKHKRSKGCLYFNRLEEIDSAILKQVIALSVARIKNNEITL